MILRVDELTRRLDRLKGLQQPDDLDQPVRTALAEVWASGRAPEEIKIRSAFIALNRPLVGELSDHRPPPRSAGPPLARLVASHGVALRTALITLFVAQCSKLPPHKMGGLQVEPLDAAVGWCDLVLAVAASRPNTVRAVTARDNRIRQVKSALDRMASPDLGLVEQPRAGTARRKYEDMVLLHEGGIRPAGQAPVYRLPKDNEFTVTVPREFFTQGWISVLDDSELAAWLMFRHCFQTSASGAEAGVTLSGEHRLAVYGQRRTVWDRHKVLGTLGLLRHERDDRRRDDGTLEDFPKDGPGDLHRFWMVDEPLSAPALNSALADLSAEVDALAALPVT